MMDKTGYNSQSHFLLHCLLHLILTVKVAVVVMMVVVMTVVILKGEEIVSPQQWTEY
jgi:hypothetical protein